ncbi:nicotinamide/nicotinic acid mononucleotide adenylyltransferase 1 [Galendromus occidentalis]|uniref:Nicotinamide/nicotinic acid mononucleotide adenylyltransferase 3 n=1 Tax=Galendromus occidentalis TaxID=34638 RepID=A0AAJ7L6Q5_9ACAR|nr:nicotinamide/nicotinic acid mononucleotide adenylyltransferase 1 [Galendromus occidentalis]
MCRLALQSSDWISVDTWEVSQEGWTRTLKVLEHFRAFFNDRDTESSPGEAVKPTESTGREEQVGVRLLCGGDLLESFAKPGLWEDEDIRKIVGDFGLVVIGRSSSNPEKFIYDHDIVYENRRNIHIATEWFSNDVSSTKVRNAVRRGESIKYVVQDSVIDYIAQKRLYREK